MKMGIGMWLTQIAVRGLVIGGTPPVLALSSGSITVTADGYPAPPRLTNNNGTITAEAA